MSMRNLEDIRWLSDREIKWREKWEPTMQRLEEELRMSEQEQNVMPPEAVGSIEFQKAQDELMAYGFVSSWKRKGDESDTPTLYSLAKEDAFSWDAGRNELMVRYLTPQSYNYQVNLTMTYREFREQFVPVREKKIWVEAEKKQNINTTGWISTTPSTYMYGDPAASAAIAYSADSFKFTTTAAKCAEAKVATATSVDLLSKLAAYSQKG